MTKGKSQTSASRRLIYVGSNSNLTSNGILPGLNMQHQMKTYPVTMLRRALRERRKLLWNWGTSKTEVADNDKSNFFDTYLFSGIATSTDEKNHVTQEGYNNSYKVVGWQIVEQTSKTIFIDP